MDSPSSPENLPAAQATDLQEQQLSDINTEIVELVEEIDYQDREISILRDFNVQQGLLLKAAARFSAYCHSRINRHQNKLEVFGGDASRKDVERLVAELEVHDIRKTIVRLVEELEDLLTDRDAVGENLRAITENVACVIEQIQQIENEPPDLLQAKDIGSDPRENPVEHREGDRMPNSIGEQLADIQAVNRRFQNPGLAELSHVREKAIGGRRTDAQELAELMQQNHSLEEELYLSQKRIDKYLQQADELKRQLEKRELECQEHQAELGRLRGRNDDLAARLKRCDKKGARQDAELTKLRRENRELQNANDDLKHSLEDEGTRQDVEHTKLRRENKKLQDANDLLRSEIKKLENRITPLESRNGDDGVSVGGGGGSAGRGGGKAGRGGRAGRGRGRIQQGDKKLQHVNEDLQAESPKQSEVVDEPKLQVIIEPRKAKGRAPSRRRKQLDEPNSPRRSKRLKE